MLACGAEGDRDDGSAGTLAEGSSASDGTVDDTGATQAASTATSTGDTTTAGETATSTDATGTTGGEPTQWTPAFVDRTLLCKLISNTSLEDPTENHTQTRFNLTGTDLGVPVVVDGTLHLFFGDSVGYREIWPFGEDPDSVARIDAAAVAADPTELCRNLDFYVTPDIPSVAADTDPAIERDFAGASMTPPPGEDIAAYIAQPAGPFPNMPGTFEVPAGALAHGGAMYVFYAGLVETVPATRMTLGYLARWEAPIATLPNYQVVRPIDSLYAGALGGHFVQIAPVVRDGVVYLWGTGDYRKSGVYLARLPTGALETGDGTELFDPIARAWRVAAELSQAEREAVPPLFDNDGVGELSISHIEDPGVFLALYQRELHDGGGAIVDNRIVLRVASAPEGPWSEPITLIDMADPAFQAAHCCGATCPGEQVLHCNMAGLYAAYLVPAVVASEAPDGAWTLELPFLVSTWDPYNVVLFEARVELSP
jgi:hypothetical protein